jgi:hypothetical protein
MLARMSIATKRKPGRKPKAPDKRTTHHLGAGVTYDELLAAERVCEERGQSKSAIIRAAFGLPPATT